MKGIHCFSKIFIHTDPVDMRKSINGLSVIVARDMGGSFEGSHLFIFCNKRRTHLKMLHYDKNGFCLWLKRLEKDRFPWSKDGYGSVIEMNLRELELLLNGIDVWKKFKNLDFEKVF